MKRPIALSPRATRWLIVAGLLAAWEVVPRMGLVPALFLPSLSDTLVVGARNWHEYTEHLWVTLKEVAIAGFFSCTAGILLGVLAGGTATARRLLLPVLSSLYAVPLIIIYPLLAAWFGVGVASKIWFAGVYGLLPTVLATAAGVRTIPPQFVLTASSMGASTSQKVWRVMIPAAMPAVLAGMRLGGALVIVGVVVTEMLSSQAGIGFLITQYRTLMDTPQVFFAILLVVAITVLFDRAMLRLESRTAAWREA
ncbi:MAG TPA: ABC transporter permease [Ramlibacter sp.]|uniref:ABC transporter permease n=1 Tax=Ramlibacter sp. TaxID=1917967 RepID=UPI002BE6D67E|nr:ABC transporter permease [Ramlibacter sp.]HVZ45432.1 ABC transporter permease [Ramlibacter sp.]